MRSGDQASWKRQAGPTTPICWPYRGSLAAAYLAAGRTADAISLYEVTINAQVSTLGPDHPITLDCRSNLAVAYFLSGRRAEAINL